MVLVILDLFYHSSCNLNRDEDVQLLLSNDYASADNATLKLKNDIVVRALAAVVDFIPALVEFVFGHVAHESEILKTLEEALGKVALFHGPHSEALGEGR